MLLLRSARLSFLFLLPLVQAFLVVHSACRGEGSTAVSRAEPPPTAAGAPDTAMPPRPSPSPEARPDIVLVVVDTLRADHLGCYGYERPTSPSIDRLAAEGVRFERAVAQAAWTFASVPSMMTSRYPQDHSDFWVQDRPGARIARGSTTLPGALRSAGYRTVLVSGHGALGAILGLRDDFDRLDIGQRSASEVVDHAVAELALPRERPLFLWVHLMDPHAPYTPPPPFDERFEDHGAASAPRASPTLEPVEAQYAGRGGIPRIALIDGPRTLAHYVARYDGEVAHADAEIGRLRQALEQTAARAGTLVAVTADHGESLGEHGLYFSHTYDLADPILHVPWILWWPGRLRPLVVPAQVMLLDLAPTVAALVGVDRPATWLGRDLSTCLSAGRCDDRDAFATRGVERAVRTRRWKLVCDRPASRCELFDLEADPGETRDVGRAHRDVVAALRRGLASWSLEHPERPELRGGSGIAGEVDEETMRALRSLGYAR